MQITEIPVSDIKVKFRLRTPSESKIQEIAESISQVGLLNPVTLDSSLNLIAGFHRLTAYKALGKESIPSIIKESTPEFGELMEVDENLKRNELNHIEVAEHIVRREELMDQLGLTYSQGDNRFTTQEEKLTIEDLADGIGLSKRSYQQRKQISKINEEVRNLLVESEFANSLMDLVKLSSEPEHIQISVCDLLITGKCKSWTSAFYNAKYNDFKLNSVPRLDFNFQERFGEYPQSIMKFKKSDDDLRKVCNLVDHNEELRPQKGETNFGQTKIKLHQMNPDQALFALDYYTNNGDLIMDPFNGRATTAITSLYLQRKFIGYEINPVSYKRTTEVLTNNMNVSPKDWTLYQGCGCAMKELKSESEILDGVFSSPPYYLKAEPYNDIEGDLCNMNIEKFDQKIDQMFENLSRLIKKSNYEKRIFHPIIFVLGTARDGKGGIFDMSHSFQTIAKRHSLTLWDQMFVQLNNPHLCTSIQRNFELKFVHKNYESQMVWVKF